MTSGEGVPRFVAEHIGTAHGRRAVLRGVGFSLEQGEILAVVGANGAGKTTLLEALAGLRPRSSGRGQPLGCGHRVRRRGRR